MRTTRENPSEAPMAIMRDPDQLGSQRAAKPRLNQEQSYLAFSPPGHRSGHWPVKHSSSTQIQIGFFTLFREMCKLCSLLARARAFFFSFSPFRASSSATSTRTAATSLASATKRPVGSSAPSPTLRRQGAIDRKILMRTTRETHRKHQWPSCEIQISLGSQRAAKPRLRPTRSSPTSRSVLPDTGRGTGLSNTLLQLKFKSVFLPCFEKCANFAHFSRARARFSFLLALSARHRQRHQRAPLTQRAKSSPKETMRK